MKYRDSKTRINLLYVRRVSPYTGPMVQCAMGRTLYDQSGLTLMEMLIALAIIGIVFAAILPQFRVIMGSWDSKQGSAEVLQNGRVLIDHLNRNLSKAVQITAVSDLSEVNGYIEFEDNDGNNLRYDVGANSYVEFGAVGNLYELAGPVSRFQFTCYDACDLDTPITTVADIRCVKVEATLTNTGPGQDKTYTTSAYLRTNGNVSSGSSSQTSYDYSNRNQGIDIFAYDGEDNKQLPNSSTEPTDVLSSDEYDDIEVDEGIFHTYNVSDKNKYAQIRFVIKIDESENDVTQITATFNGKGINSRSGRTDGASFFIWNYSSSDYELLEESADTEAEVTLSGTLSSSITDYIGGSGDNIITLLAVSNSKLANKYTLTLFTDYVKLEITEGSGGGILP